MKYSILVLALLGYVTSAPYDEIVVNLPDYP